MATFFELEDGALVNLDNVTYVCSDGLAFTNGSEHESYGSANSLHLTANDMAKIKRQFSGNAVASAIKSLQKQLEDVGSIASSLAAIADALEGKL